MSWWKKLRGNKSDSESGNTVASEDSNLDSLVFRSKGLRHIRIFISSTFADMQQERDVLIKTIFPELRRICAARGVGLTDVDLRWGVTRKQAQRGEVLPICLHEIEHCRPYFIGLLGERYGWVPDRIDSALAKEIPWLKEQRDKSVTELEILHGVLNNPAMADHAFFYFRDPDSPLTVREDDPASRKKLDDLKNRIRNSSFPVVEDYADPERLGRLILDDFTRTLDSDFPERDLSDLDRERFEHEAFAHSRSRIYISRPDELDRLDTHMTGAGLPLAILGESGSGKSTLIANWAMRYRNTHPDAFLLLHFIGSSTESADVNRLIRRIMGEIKARFELSEDIPDAPDKLKEAFPNWLSLAGAREPLILVLDALNQLENRDQASDLYWLPESPPPGVRLIVSTLPGQAQDVIEARGWSTVQIAPLNTGERKELIERYLGWYAKSLSARQTKQIAKARQTSNPLFLRTLLEELRVFGIFERLDEHIGHYLKATEPKQLFTLVLERLEEDYEKEYEGLICEALTAIYAARRGLTEAELRELFDIAPLVWSPLFNAMSESFVSRSGLLGFGHDYLRQAVYERYLKNDDQVRAVRRKLADYFDAKDLDDRKVEELPWLLSRAGEWVRLRDTLGDPAFVSMAYLKDDMEVKTFWQRVEDNMAGSCVDTYRPVIDNPETHIEAADAISLLLDHRGHHKEALRLREAESEYWRKHSNDRAYQSSMGNLAGLYVETGNLKKAGEIYDELETVFREKEAWIGLAYTLGNKAGLFHQLGDFENAILLYKSQADICRKLTDLSGWQTASFNRANLLTLRCEWEEAERLLDEAEQLSKQTGNMDALAQNTALRADIHTEKREWRQALSCLETAKEVFRESGNVGGRTQCHLLTADVLNNMGQFDEAENALDHAMDLATKARHMHYIAMAKYKKGNLAYLRMRHESALNCYKSSETIYREIKHKHGVAESLYGQANVAYSTKYMDRAWKLYAESKKFYEEISDAKGMLGCQIGIGNVKNALGQFHDALDSYAKAENLARERKLKHELGKVLRNQANTFQALGRMSEALHKLEELERISDEIGDQDTLVFLIGSRAMIHKAQGDHKKALRLLEKQAAIRKKLGDQQGLMSSLNNLANIYRETGDEGKALERFRETASLARELKLMEPYGITMVNVASLLLNYQKSPAKALPCAEEAFDILQSQNSPYSGKARQLVDKIRRILNK